MHFLGEVKHLISEYDIRPKRSLGQSFCVNNKLLERMVAYAHLCKDDIVLEIGAGFGFLTRLLSERAKRVITVELDSRLLNALRYRLGDRENITMVLGNVLELDLPNYNKVVANPPYYISSPLIMLLFSRSFDCAVLTLQKEFAEKLVAQVGTREYGPLAVVVGYKAVVEILEHTPRDSFYPQPDVESVVVFIKTRKPEYNVIDEGLFFKVVKFLFTQRDRKVKKPLESFFIREMKIGKTEAKLIVEDLPFIEMRVCDVKLEDFVILSNKVYAFLQSKRVTFRDHSFYVFPEVYMPSEDTFLMAEHLDAKEEETVLDIGTGCGLLGILAVNKARRVVAIDINPHALACAKFNAKLNHMSNKFDIILSDLFDGFKVDSKFDFIIFNPPYLPIDEMLKPKEWLNRAWYGGSSGREIIDRFLNKVDEHVPKDGRVLLIQSSLSNPEESIKIFRQKGFETEAITEEALFFEKLVVIQAKKLN